MPDERLMRFAGSMPRQRGALALLTMAAGLAVAPAVALGFARFAYALLLPAMRADLGWSYAQAGLMNTANAVGYLLGALVASPVAVRVGARRGFEAGVVVTALALLATPVTASFPALLGLRLLAGAAGGVCFVAGSLLAARLATEVPRWAAVILGLYTAGGGFGIVASGFVVRSQQGSWQAGWLALAISSLVLLPPGVLAVRRVDDVGGGDEGARRRPRSPALPRQPRPRHLLHGLWAVLGAYGLFGLGYIGFVTFGVAFLGARGATGAALTGFWILLGAAGIAGPLSWAPALDRLPAHLGLSALLGVLTLGALAPLAAQGPIGLPAGLVVSGVLFGGCFLTVPAAVTGIVRKTAAQASWSAAIGTMTTAFAAGQCLGPLLAGVLSDHQGGLDFGLAVSAAALAAASLLALAHREPRHVTSASRPLRTS